MPIIVSFTSKQSPMIALLKFSELYLSSTTGLNTLKS